MINIKLTANNMKQFKWVGINLQGKKLEGEIEAPNRAFALMELKNQPIVLLKVRRKNKWNTTLFSESISPVVILFFFRQLATLIGAGVPIVQSLMILSQTQDNRAFQKMMTVIKLDLEAGKLLGNSLRQFPRYFDALTCQLIQVGERSGTLTMMLKRIALHKEKMRHLKKKIVEALFYPAIILSVALLVSFIMLTWVVPRFAELFTTLHGTLPALTLAVIHLAHGIHCYGWVLLVPCFGIPLGFKHARKYPTLKQKIDYFFLKIPLLGVIWSKALLARFARSLAIAFSAGVPIIEALKMITEVPDNRFYEQLFVSLQREIAKGQQLHTSMHKLAAFPAMMVQMVRIGEESGMLEQMLEKVADLYESDIDYLVSYVAHALEPLIIVVLGVLIGGLVIAMYLPIFKLGTLM